MRQRFRQILLLCAIIWGNTSSMHAQIDNWIYKTPYKIQPDEVGNLYFAFDNMTFFRDNEFSGTRQSGYTLPGLWILPRFIFYPLRNLKIEAGMYGLYYYGAKSYPRGSYMGIPQWSDAGKHSVHFLPFVRIQTTLYKNFNVVLGDIYGGANHQLNEALYNEEYNLTADPEGGVQLLYDHPHFFADAWINWLNFQFNGDYSQEAFIAGLSSRITPTSPDNPLQLQIPFQAIFRHEGGEIDSIDAGVKTWFNLGAGLRMSYQLNPKRFVRQLSLESMYTLSSQIDGKLWPVDKGHGIHTTFTADMKNSRIKTGYWNGKGFYSILGSPFFSNLSPVKGMHTFRRNSMVYATLEYNKQLGKSYAIGADISFYHHFATTASYMDFNPEASSWQTTSIQPEKASNSFSIGIYLRVNPSILIKKFKMKE